MRKFIPIVLVLMMLPLVVRADKPSTQPAVKRSSEDSEDSDSIDKYDFTWTVCEKGDNALDVNKTQDATTIVLRERFDSLRIVPKDAPEIARVLKTADERWKSMKGDDKEESEHVDAGKFTVTFHNDPKDGFAIWVGEKDSFSTPLTIARDAAKAFVPYLERADKLAALVDKKIQP